MRIHREGYRIIVSVFAVLVVASALITANVDSKIPQFIMYTVSIFFFYFIVRFFRVPKRHITKDENAIISPADGKVVVIEEIFEDKYFHEKRIKISIFMSAFNVHVNSYPISGEIKQVDYYPGKHMIAWYPKSSDFNEHSCVIIEHANKKKILVKQIAGIIARRIVCYAKEGQVIHQGDELGIIKMGSRVDVLLPIDAKIFVELGESVRSKKTILAFFE